MGGGRKKVRNVRPKREEEVDRISRLPDDLIHHILSNMDAKDVIQTCLVSTRWRHVWRSLPHLNFDACHFSRMLMFTKFVSKFLSKRSCHSDISVFNFNSGRRKIDISLIRKISLYTRNAQKLNITYCSLQGGRQLSLSVFNSGSLKELCLNTRDLIVTNIDRVSLNLGALTTLVFIGVTFVTSYNDGSGKSIAHFSNLLNLRHLTLAGCQTSNSNNLRVHLILGGSQTSNPNALNIISPRLETLTILHWLGRYDQFVVLAPNLSSFNYRGLCPLHPHFISSDSFPCIERVNIDVHHSYESKKMFIRDFIGLFHKLRNATFLTLAIDTVRLLSSVPELLENQTSPFRNLNCLKIVKSDYWLREPAIPSHAITYLCNSSPNSSVINECEEFFTTLETGDGN